MQQLRKISILKVTYFNFKRLSSSAFDHDNVSKTSKIIDDCINIRSSIQSLNDKVKGPLSKSTQKNTILPFVFLLGNHSSGKSSFVNYICQRKVQVAGVAPTDDNFTIIAPGPTDVDSDGPALIGDPDMGFSGLRTFGPQLVHHTQLKVRSNLAISNFMIVDSPGMIDSPMLRDTSPSQFVSNSKLSSLASLLTDSTSKRAVMERGYDFEKVCKWFAERADVILLFFDPDKPGTTGETLQILTNSLVGMDNKLHIILNKADQFKQIHDFARAYGSLCWNLSKVIHRKDLPQIYTMCLPPSHRSNSNDSTLSNQEKESRNLIDLEETREVVVEKVLNAPYRRIDNEISRLSDSLHLLHMHCTIISEIVRTYRKNLFNSRLYVGFAHIVGVGIVSGTVALGLPFEAIIASSVIGGIGMISSIWWQNKYIDEQVNILVNEKEIEKTFIRLYSKKISEKDEFIISLWNRVISHLRYGFTSHELKGLSAVSKNDLLNLENLLDVEIPKLRRLAAPSVNK